MTYKAYYQWVPFVLMLQACLFYAPHVLHKSWEGGKVPPSCGRGASVSSGVGDHLRPEHHDAGEERQARQAEGEEGRVGTGEGSTLVLRSDGTSV